MSIEAPSTIFNGQKAVILIDNKIAGIFTSCTYSFSYDLQPNYILGRSGPAAFTYTGQSPVNVRLSGFRVIGSGPFGNISTMPQLKDLLNYKGITVDIYSRDPNDKAKTKDNSGKLFSVKNFMPSSFSTGISARGISDVTVDGLGAYYEDESADNMEAAGAVTLKGTQE